MCRLQAAMCQYLLRFYLGTRALLHLASAQIPYLM